MVLDPQYPTGELRGGRGGRVKSDKIYWKTKRCCDCVCKLCIYVYLYVLDEVGGAKVCLAAILCVSENMREFVSNDLSVLSCKYTTFSVYGCFRISACMCFRSCEIQIK